MSSDDMARVFGLWFLIGVVVAVLLLIGVGEGQRQIDHLYDVVNFSSLSQADFAANTTKLYQLVSTVSFLGRALWVSIAAGLVAPALGYLGLMVRRRISN